MVKSGQGQHPTVKSTLNFFNECVLFILSGTLWLYCLISVFILFALFSLQDFEVAQFFRIFFNLEKRELVLTMMGLLAAVGVITVYLLSTFSLTKWRQRRYETMD
ncbi:intracellular adhesion protein IcaD [Macrococcoides caseolyticum]|uniref:intracellular adhesion protein IcaD n=1 Tax=Macrococcoides caseolyticum TaxID=69966 RepID=UPI003F5F4236